MSRGTHMTGNRQWWRDPGQHGDARKNAAHHLAIMARRFISDRANVREVEEAIALWRDAAPPPAKGETPGACPICRAPDEMHDPTPACPGRAGRGTP